MWMKMKGGKSNLSSLDWDELLKLLMLTHNKQKCSALLHGCVTTDSMKKRLEEEEPPNMLI